MPVRVDFTGQYDPYALWLPSLQKGYAQFPLRASRAGGFARFDPKHLDFLDDQNPYWTCKNLLYSAGQFTKPVLPHDDIVAHSAASRARTGGLILGDSGGFQVAKGTLPTLAHLKALKQAPGPVMAAWKANTGPMATILRWLDLNADYGMTLDMPLWIVNEANSSSPFAKMTVEDLTALTVFNLDYFGQNRGLPSGKRAGLLNVLHDAGGGSGDAWYKAVTPYRFEGWALGGDTKKDLRSKLYWIERLLRDGLLDDAEVIHVLMASPPKDAVRLTAIQQRLRAILGTDIRVTYDSSSPFQHGGKFEQYALEPELTADIRTWSIPVVKFPQGPQYVDATTRTRIPKASSPILKALRVDDLHRQRGTFAQKYLTQLGQHILVNHNLFVYHQAAIDACDFAFHPTKRNPKRIPKQLRDDLDLIERTLK